MARQMTRRNLRNNYKMAFVWAPDVNKFDDESGDYSSTSTSFDDLFSHAESATWRVVTWKAEDTAEVPYLLRDVETRWFPELTHGNVTRSGVSTATPLALAATRYSFDQGMLRGRPVACCVCPGTDWECTPWMGLLQPARALQLALDELRARLGDAPKILHLRNTDTKGVDFDNASTSLSLTPWRVHELLSATNFTYAAVEHPDDARLLRKLSPTTLMQQDFRQVEYGRNTVGGHRTSAFELFALSMVRDWRDVTTTFGQSSFLRVSRCLRKPGEDTQTHQTRTEAMVRYQRCELCRQKHPNSHLSPTNGGCAAECNCSANEALNLRDGPGKCTDAPP